ncbi:MAG: DUF1735 domain-containing protein [Clostridium sp.]|nr:DUF1735 domain-containing protein [Bacteroides sp.]MCM1197297.1 DUF1735 domain-containing protein [Clostridium sp.]
MNFKSMFIGFAAIMSAMTFVSCEEKVTENDTLSVEPSAAISFEATGNDDVTLTVTTSAKEWNVTAPEWIIASSNDNVLTLNVQDNTSDEPRVDRILVTAGNAEPVRINVFQSEASSDVPVVGGVAVKMTNNLESTAIFTKSSDAITLSVTVSLDKAAAEDVEVELFVDNDYLTEYNFLNGESCVLYPADKITLPESKTVKIAAGATESEAIEVVLDPSALEYGSQYLVPLYLKAVKNASVKQSACRVNYVVMKQNPRSIKNVVYLEVNDTNPLNALEYVLEDGTPFFDAVILFAANINYDSANDVVYLHNNPNVQALLDESDVYIQPLRKAGIKVYLGLLGNHDAAGLAQLSDWGAAEWAKEVAQTCKTYGLDGVNLDDEYSSTPDLSNPWFTNKSGAAGARLCYELKMAMKEACSWPTEVSYFVCGSLGNLPTVTIDNVTHTQSEFIDFYVANYGGKSSPYGDLTYANCSGASVQLNYGDSLSESSARSIKEQGYGWCMWFAFDPSGTGGISSNRSHSVTQFKKAARGFYDQELKEPTGVYNKIGEGKYDPERHLI